MGDILTLQRKPDRAECSARSLMLVFVGAWGMMFASLWVTYAFVRIPAEAWPPDGVPPLPKLLPALSSLALIAACGLLELGRRAIQRNQARLLMGTWSAAAVLGLTFLALQGVYLVTCRRLGVTGSFGTLFLMYIFFHGLHLAAGLPGVGVVIARARAGRYGALNHVGVRMWSAYWYFAAAVWLLMYLSVYLT